MLVTIVAKTRMGGGACVGGITDDGRSVRLIAADAEFNEHFNLDYHVGETWEIVGKQPDNPTPPHTENVVVYRKKCLGRTQDLRELIERHMPPRTGGLDALYDGLAQGAEGGPLYIAARAGVPDYSTMFWRPDQPLTRDTSGKRIRYRYPTADGGRTITFVGFQEPPETLPAGTLLRVSLAHWWRPMNEPEKEQRCYLQLSGWFHESSSDDTPPDDEEPLFDEHRVRSRNRAAAAPELPSVARQALKDVFGYDDFRPLQREVIANVLAKQDSLAVMPTGSGKSMCFQLPAVLSAGLTVVVSPLIALMEDQVMQLRQIGVAAAYLNSMLSYDDYLAVTQHIRAGRVKLLYAAPETLLRPETLLMLEELQVDCLTIDEAHCISEWGHDFRPEFRQLVQVRRRLPDAVCLAMTATATERVRRDIKATLGITDADEFISSFDRANLFLSVVPREDGLRQITDFLAERKEESGIIYCNTRKQVDDLAGHLAEQGWDALPYHAGLDNETRRQNQRRFTYGEGVIIVATIAFGMGINKSNVRFIIHHDLPKDLENYYQQIGRAGRDGLPADCLLLLSRQDAATINFLMDRNDPSQRAAASARLQAMIAYAETERCRRRPLLAYFGETPAADNCGQCDNCLAGEHELADLTVPAQKFLSCVARTGEFFGATYLIDVLRGSRRKELLARGHDRLSTYNIGNEYTRKEWQQLARQFVSHGLLSQDLDHGSLKLTPKGRDVLRGEVYMGTPPAAERRSRRAVDRDYDVDLFARLRAVRMELAAEEGVPAFVVFSDATLREMAIHYPQSPETLNQIQGIGTVKLERYGEAVLAVIRAYCEERGIAERPKEPPAPIRPAAPRSPNRREAVAKLYRNGQSVGEIAALFNVRPATVVNNLWETLRNGEPVDPDPLPAESTLSAAERERVLAAFAELGVERLRPVYDALQERVSYDELHLWRLYVAAMAVRGH